MSIHGLHIPPCPLCIRTLVVDDGEEKSFPRGGHQTLTPLERRVIRQRAKEDVLFSEVLACNTSLESMKLL